MTYRPDIDGLRAVAVLSVILYHFQSLCLGGGYIGVDIFFVISGYLIGGIVIDETARRRFSYAQFYARRVRRLFPAFFVVGLVTLLFGWWLLLPIDFWAEGKSLVAATAFASNILFYREVDYFDAAANAKPLLHTWSLGVEEQFYIFFPPLMRLAVRTGPQWLPAILVAAALLSLGYSQHLLAIDSAASFYWLPSRAWELLLGAAAGLPAFAQLRLRPAVLHALTGLSVVALFLPMLLYTPATPFPGVAAVPSCLGTAWLLFAGGQRNAGGAVTRVLSTRLPVAVGKISYSRYLWHWPVIVFLTYYEAGEVGWISRVIALLLTFALAIASWRFVEQPARYGQYPRSLLFAGAVLGSLVLAGVGAAAWHANGAPGRLAPNTRLIADAAGDFFKTWEGCVTERNDVLPGISFCRVGVQGVPPTFAVWGDSHARVMRDGIDKAAKRVGVGGFLIWAGGCIPAFDLEKQESATGPRSDRACVAQNAAIRGMFASHTSIKKVLLISRWAYYVEGRGLGMDSQNVIAERAGGQSPLSDGGVDQATVVTQALRNTVRWLHQQGYAVYLLEQMPEIPDFSGRRLFQLVRGGHASAADGLIRIGTVARADVEQRQLRANAALSLASADGGATILPTHGLFCDQAYCRAATGETIVPGYFDNNHITDTTSRRIFEVFAPAMAP
jgi:peptidoglycan/LPS O-acetylase OafA/YrhL